MTPSTKTKRWNTHRPVVNAPDGVGRRRSPDVATPGPVPPIVSAQPTFACRR